jgi:ketosteroid isomerase-like protein
MKKLFLIFFSVFLGCVFTGCREPAEVAEEIPVDLSLSAEDVAAINKLGPEFSNMVTGEAFSLDSLLEFFTDDMVMIGPEMPAMEGKAAYREWIEPLGVKMSEASFDFREVGGSGDTAYVYMNYTEKYTLNGIAEPVDDTGNVLAILQKQPDGTWLFSHWMWAPEKPLDQ